MTSPRQNPFPPRGGRWPEGPDEGDRAERDGSDRSTCDAIDRRPPALSDISKATGVQRSHLAPLDPPHPSLLRNDTFPRKGGKVVRPAYLFQTNPYCPTSGTKRSISSHSPSCRSLES